MTNKEIKINTVRFFVEVYSYSTKSNEIKKCRYNKIIKNNGRYYLGDEFGNMNSYNELLKYNDKSEINNLFKILK